jgi:hypothetical protein
MKDVFSKNSKIGVLTEKLGAPRGNVVKLAGPEEDAWRES